MLVYMLTACMGENISVGPSKYNLNVTGYILY